MKRPLTSGVLAWVWPLVPVGLTLGAGGIAACSGSDGGTSASADAGGTAIAEGGASFPGSDASVADSADAAPAQVDASTPDAAFSSDGSVHDGAPDAGTDAAPATSPFDASAPADASLGTACASMADDAANSVPPARLACTGLYGNWPARTLNYDVAPYDPGFHLWSDGAEKARFIHLPPGAQIDTTAMDEWSFPVGTKIWKQFTVDGKKAETRFLWKTQNTGSASDWVRTTYQWAPDESDAVQLTTGALVPRTDGSGTSYEIPSADVCETCHEGRQDFVLGFEAVSLASPGSSGMNLRALEAASLLTVNPSAPLVVPGNADEQAALGWLHANCGTTCHNRSPTALSGARDTGLFMRLEVGHLKTVRDTDTYQTAVGQAVADLERSNRGESLPASTCTTRIVRGDSAHSCVPFRDGVRDPDDAREYQMPPINTGSHQVDVADVAVVKKWIDAMGPDY